jgi:iron complex transport system ATP-binding protein
MRNVTVRRGNRTVLDDVTMSASPGEIIILVGPNGAGKSTLLATLASDLQASSGTIEMNGTAIREMSTLQLARTRAVYSSAEHTRLGYTAREIVEFGRRSVPASGRDDDARAVAESMQATECDLFANRVFAALSEGERARVVLARVFAQDTPILLLDEPTASLDIRHQHLVLQHVRRLATSGRTIIAAIHDLNLACIYADRIGLLKEGRLIAIDQPANVISGDVLEDVFGWPMTVIQHPTRLLPIVLPGIEQGEQS